MIILESALILLLSYLFLSAGLSKLRNQEYFKSSLDNYQLFPSAGTGLVSVIIIGVELLVSVAVLIPATKAGSLVLMLILLLTYAAGMGINLGRGRSNLDCGCNGPGQKQVISWPLVIRNIAISGVALALVLLEASLPSTVANGLLSVLFSCFVIVAFQAVNKLWQNQKLLNQRFEL